METLYLAYGSNADPAQMVRRCPRAVAVGRATLAGYRLAFAGYSARWDGGVATLVPAAATAVATGVLYRVTTADLAALDGFEGHPGWYARRTVRVRDARGVFRRAAVYLLPATTPPAWPSPAYLAALLRGYAAHGLGRAAVLAALAATPRAVAPRVA